ncbi:MAG: hypothetical protein LC802_14355 [Acidobacteria bacterium]|nr:hypothetical protein [Acidobacteriota bacterium]
MLNKLIAGVGALALSVLAVGCSAENETANANMTNSNMANSNAAPMSGGNMTSEAPDNSEVRTENVGGVTTETRTFRNPNSRVERVVVTTRNGKRTARVYYRDKSVKELPDNDVERALDATGDALVSAGGKVVDVSKEIGDKAEDVGGATVNGAKKVGSVVGDKAEDVGGATVNGAKKVGSVTADKAEDVGGATVNGAKRVGKATARGAKKVGGAIKDAVTP